MKAGALVFRVQACFVRSAFISRTDPCTRQGPANRCPARHGRRALLKDSDKTASIHTFHILFRYESSQEYRINAPYRDFLTLVVSIRFNMEDVKFTRSHSRSPLPEAGNDPQDPLRPEIDEENSISDPTIAAPDQDMEVTEQQPGMPDDDDDDLKAGLSDNESVLSEALDDDQFDEQFGEFDASNIAIEERPAQAIDEDNVKQIGVHKRKRTGAEGDEPKKKKKRADKPRRKKNKDGEDGDEGGEGDRRSKRSKKAGRVRAASPDEDADANLTPEERAFIPTCTPSVYADTKP